MFIENSAYWNHCEKMTNKKTLMHERHDNVSALPCRQFCMTLARTKQYVYVYVATAELSHVYGIPYMVCVNELLTEVYSIAYELVCPSINTHKWNHMFKQNHRLFNRKTLHDCGMVIAWGLQKIVDYSYFRSCGRANLTVWRLLERVACRMVALLLLALSVCGKVMGFWQQPSPASWCQAQNAGFIVPYNNSYVRVVGLMPPQIFYTTYDATKAVEVCICMQGSYISTPLSIGPKSAIE